jgi:nitrogen fixation NifU-like protein
VADATLYGGIVLDHYRHPRNQGALPACTHAADGANPLCGDRLRIELRFEHGHVLELRHAGEACAVSTAAASMMSELVAGLDAQQIAALGRQFEHFVAGEADDAGLGPLAAMRDLQNHPARRKCALLPWATLYAALAGDARATTETESA